MAKQQAVKCPFCGSKVDDDGGKYRNHTDSPGSNLPCPMSGRPVEGKRDSKDDNRPSPVTDGPSV